MCNSSWNSKLFRSSWVLMICLGVLLLSATQCTRPLNLISNCLFKVANPMCILCVSQMNQNAFDTGQLSECVFSPVHLPNTNTSNAVCKCSWTAAAAATAAETVMKMNMRKKTANDWHFTCNKRQPYVSVSRAHFSYLIKSQKENKMWIVSWYSLVIVLS